MSKKILNQLSRRERQIMDVLFELEECNARDVMEKIPDSPGYSAVRALIARLVDKGVVNTRTVGNKKLYQVTIDESHARKSAIVRLLKTFFKGSRTQAVSALLENNSENISPVELDQIQRTIDKIRKNNLDSQEVTNAENKVSERDV